MSNKVILVSVFDTKVKQYMQLIPVRTIEEAIRSFRATVEQADHDFSKWAEDYSLWKLAEYDPSEGTVASLKPQQLAQALEFKKKLN